LKTKISDLNKKHVDSKFGDANHTKKRVAIDVSKTSSEGSSDNSAEDLTLLSLEYIKIDL
jgi:hypothetical protein